MNSKPWTVWRGLAAVVGVAALAVVAACGGGGGDSTSSGTPVGGNTGGSTGGSTPGAVAASFTQGPIEGFGSIIVGGIRYDDSSATIEDDNGNRRSSDDLRLGQVVQIEASSVDRSNSTATALRVRLGIEIVGPITAIDTTANTITVFGQVIEISSSTVFDDSLSGGFPRLAIGMVIEAHGLPDAATNHLVATRIEAETGATSFHLRGTVSALDTTLKTFMLGSERISYAGLAAAAVPADLADGIAVKVRVNTTQVDGAWVATSLRTPSRPSSNLAEVHIEGVITVFNSASSFEINGLEIDASGAAYPQGSAGIGMGVRVEVEGRMSNGVLVATKVSIEDRHGHNGRGLELKGTISSLDTTAKTFVVRNVTVSYSGSVNFKDGSESDLANDRRVEVKGTLSADRTHLQATKIEFE